jgi:hypothetical protein
MTKADAHPSRFHPAILEAMAPTLRKWALPIHDPFAGTGQRLAALAASLDLTFTGTELEAPFIVDSSVAQGDATKRESYPDWEHCVATSPVYPNGMTDHFHARDNSRRYTYRQARAAITGRDEPLHGNNMGRYGPRGGRQAEFAYWLLAERSLRWWPERVLVNVKDCYLDHKLYNAVDRWRIVLACAGYTVTKTMVETPGMNDRAAADKTWIGHEAILVATR